MSNKSSSSRRRLSPEARRLQIIEAARQVFAQHPDGDVSTADVAEVAGVTRALVHHYFHGIEQLRQAVALQIAATTVQVLAPDSGATVGDRVRANVKRSLDAVDANRDVWFATLGGEGAAGDSPAGRAMRQAVLEQIIANNAEIIDDTPWTRLCLTGYLGLSDSVCRRWLHGEADRPAVEHLLVDTLLHLLLHTIPDGPPTSG